MSKIICDICGTTYAETAKQCPICGSVRPGDAQRVTNEVKNDGKVSTGYTYVKGGRFSKSNVKKRASGHVPADNGGKKNPPVKEGGEDAKSNRGLVVTAIVLLLAIIGVVIYIALRFFAPISDLNADNTTNTVNTSEVSCTDLVLDETEVLFEEIGIAKLLNVTVSPENTTDKITYASEDESIATVTDKGKITAVAEGTTKIIITCGNVVKECVVTIQFPTETTLPTIEDTTSATEDTTVPDDTTPVTEEFRLNRKEFTLSYKGETWNLYSGSLPKNQITWSVGDESVATVDNGKVVAVGNGYTYVYAEYEGQKVSCQVICNFKESSGIQGNGGVSEDGGGSSSSVITGYCDCNQSINIRSGPGTSYSDVGDLFKNEKVTITETQQGSDGYMWGKIGTDKWVAMNYIKTN